MPLSRVRRAEELFVPSVVIVIVCEIYPMGTDALRGPAFHSEGCDVSLQGGNRGSPTEGYTRSRFGLCAYTLGRY